MLQKQIAEFKKVVRKIKKHAVPEEMEWVLETSYSNKHRLKGAAIENRQAAIRGRPKVNTEDAEKIMKMIMAIRGLDKKKHLDEWQESNLKVLPHKMKLQGSAQAWRRAVLKGENRK